MLTISREAPVKIGKHAWAVYPLEASGYLLGRTEEMVIYAALPCSKTRQWDEYGDRWFGIEEHLDQAKAVASAFDLEVVGFYASTERNLIAYPTQFSLVNRHHIILIYGCICCPQCSGFEVRYDNRWLRRGEEYVVYPGIRVSSSMNQKRVLKEWRKLHGQIDYTNGSQERLLAGIPLRRK